MPSIARSGSSNDFFLVRIDLWVLLLAAWEGVAGTDLEILPPFAGFVLEDVLPIVVDNSVKNLRQSPPVCHSADSDCQTGTDGGATSPACTMSEVVESRLVLSSNRAAHNCYTAFLGQPGRPACNHSRATDDRRRSW